MEIIYTRDNFRTRRKANFLIRLRKFLMDMGFVDDDVRSGVIRGHLVQFVGGRISNRSQIERLERTILEYSIDFLKNINLYRVNRGILLVACVEYVLCPGEDDEEYLTIYGLDDLERAIRLYNRLCRLPEDHESMPQMALSAICFFRCEKFVRFNRCLEEVRRYLRDIEIDDDELEYIRCTSMELISREAFELFDWPA